MTGRFRRREVHFDPPVEMRFVDLFMIIVVTLMFITVMLIIISASIRATRVDTAPSVSTKALPPALVDQRYDLTLAGSGGAGPYSWRVAEGTLPNGLWLEPSTGVIAGVPKELERKQFTIEMVDAEKRPAKRELSLEVRFATKEKTSEVDQIRVATAALILPDAIQGTSYRFRFSANGGNPPYTWTVQEGKLPDGLKLTESGDVIGVPSSVESSSMFEVAIKDAIGTSTKQPVRILVGAQALPWWKWTLGWVVYITAWVFTVLGALVVIIILYFLSEGIPPTGPKPAMPGWKGFRPRLKELIR